MNYRFIISLYGNRQQGMLLPLLFSITKTNPEAGITLFWEEIDENLIALMQKCFPKAEFVKTNFNFGDNIAKRISSKTVMWEYAIRKKPDEYLAFIDADVLLIRNVASFFEKIDADIILTVDNENKYPLNTGVILCHSVAPVQSFFSAWKKETQNIFEIPTLYEMANNKALAYGGTDQMAIQRLIDFEKEKNSYLYNNIKISSIPRHQMNETNSVPITPDIHIIHYKGGWNGILFQGKNFTPNRPKSESWEMYIFYLRNYADSINYLNKKTDSNFLPEDFGLVIPFYLNRNNFKENKWLYPLYCVYSWIKNLPGRLKRFYDERINSHLSWL